MANRRIEREIMDEVGDAEAARSLQDLRRINRWLGGHRIARGLVGRLYAEREHFSLLDVGAASGDMGRAVQIRFPLARVIAADHVPRNLALALEPKIVADAFHLPLASGSVDIVFCSLFLHHFPDEKVVMLLREMQRVARRAVVVIDLERNVLARGFVPATRWLFRWSTASVHDAPVSVAAGFRAGELAELGRRAGLQRVRVRRHWPWFRLSLVCDCG